MSPEPTAQGSISNPASTGSPERGAASIRYVDRADMVETFADSVTGLIFDGQTLRRLHHAGLSERRRDLLHTIDEIHGCDWAAPSGRPDSAAR
jgi:hypothetical protein